MNLSNLHFQQSNQIFLNFFEKERKEKSSLGTLGQWSLLDRGKRDYVLKDLEDEEDANKLNLAFKHVNLWASNTCNKMLNSSVLYIWNLENMSIKQEEHEIFDYIYKTTRLRNASKLNKSCYSMRDNWSRKTNKFNRSYPYSTNLKANNWNNITSQIWHFDN